MIEQDPIKRSNKSARCNGAVSKNAIVPKFILENYPKDAIVLDFGSGPKIPHTLMFREKGFTDIAAYDFGDNISDLQIKILIPESRELIFASNVFNTHSNAKMSAEALHLIKNTLIDGGDFIFNLPDSPNYFWTDKKAFLKLISEVFGHYPKRVDSKGIYWIDRNFELERTMI